MSHPPPSQTGSTTVEFESPGQMAGLLSMLGDDYDIEYDPEDGVYKVSKARWSRGF